MTAESQTNLVFLKVRLLALALLVFSISAFAKNDSALDLDLAKEKCRTIPAPISVASARIGYEACRTLLSEEEINPDTYFYYGRIHYFWGEMEEAQDAFQQGYAAGSTKAALAYAFMQGSERHGGLGIARDETRLAYQDAADKGDPVAMVLLGMGLTESEEIPASISRQDRAASQTLFNKAAEQGYPVAHFYLGLHYLYGCTRQQQHCSEQAMNHLSAAASGGVRDAMEILEFHDEQASGVSAPDMAYEHTTPEYLIFHRP